MNRNAIERIVLHEPTSKNQRNVTNARIRMIERTVIILLFIIALVLIIRLLVIQHSQHKDDRNAYMVMGGSLCIQADVCKAIEDKSKQYGNQSILGDDTTTNDDNEDVNNGTDTSALVNTDTDVETYFRPSKLPVQNNRSLRHDFIHRMDSSGKESAVVIPEELLKTPEETILNYFSILREAANWVEGKYAGCGTLGLDKSPYPVAYEFLSSKYQEQLPYSDYLKTFENILHINLIKKKAIPVIDAPMDTLRYFIEIETIEGMENGKGTFAYYYGFVDLIKEANQYRIANLDFTMENYLCAPYHGWAYDAEAVVDIEYGGWCSLVKERFPTEQEDYIKRIYFSGTDGNDYLIVFFQLTNDTDIEIAQYRKNGNEKWELIKLDPQDCLEEK